MQSNLSLQEFYAAVEQRAKEHPLERYGQAAFNHLYLCRPDLSEQIRATDKDPFHIRDLQDARWQRFIDFIEENWGN